VWRDLKLENVLIKADGHIAICDFDLALPNPANQSDAEAEQERQREEHSSSKGPQIYGTMDYLSPEVIQGGGHTEMSDFWAYGANKIKGF
jgi:serine/threonine protein kinase